MKRKSGGDDQRDDEHGAPPQRRRMAPSEESLQEAIKVGQRVSTEWKEAWHHWCDNRSRGQQSVYDPAKYQVRELTEFFKAMGGLYAQHFFRKVSIPVRENRGGRSQTDQGLPPRQRAGRADNEGPETLIDLVKMGQRQSTEWKEAWSVFCGEHAGGQNDPRKQGNNPVFFIAFCFRYGLGQLGSEDWSQPFLGAIAKTAMPLIVDAIKQGQRNCTLWKDAWGEFCETKQSQFRDPSRHDAGSLLQFMDTVGIPKFGSEPWMEPFVTGAYPNA
eukprot:GEMP01050009.1.p1 GENE.GEMP01050009.1~~GEMP01050009.1.p1  ORF type:complete len:273 (-),score=61.06 GEMP01050009.1:799-1617(-)